MTEAASSGSLPPASASNWARGPVLGIETSCDETAAAVVDPHWREGGLPSPVRSDVVASQFLLHAEHGGVVPELASRQHLRDVRPVVEQALSAAGIGVRDLAAVAVTAGPGLVGPLLVGTSFGKSVAQALSIPLVGVHHLEGHVRAAFLEAEEPERPYLALVVSGGHTSVFKVTRSGASRRYDQLARTLDDAAGEAFDKVGKLLGLSYPAGPAVDRLSRGFEGARVPFPRSRIKVDGGRGVTLRAFSFSGIKTAVRHHVAERGIRPLVPGEDPLERPDLLAILAGFQEAVVDMLVTPTLRLLREEGLDSLVAVGGVSANSLLRERLKAGCARWGARLLVPSPHWSTDNAAMIAAAGILHLDAGRRDGLELAADPCLALAIP